MLRRSGVPTHVRAATAWLVASVSLIAIGLRPVSGVAQETELDPQFLESFTWRSIGPANMSGRITDIEGIPGTATFYVAAATGGIWKTTNNGTTFRPLFTEERVAAMGDLAIAPSNPEIVWAGTGEEDSRNSISPGGGVYKSMDGGLTWELMGLEDTHAIGRILVHPTNADLVYVAALGHIWGANEERGLYRTRDGGESWERIHYISEKAGFVDLVMHPNDPNTLFAASWERVRGPWFLKSGGPGSALWKSTDGGDTWSEVIGGGFPTTMKGRIGLAIARSNPDVMYALVEAEEPECPEAEDSDTAACPDLHGSGLYRSEDGGRTWSWMNGENTRPFYYSQVRVDPSNPDHVVWSSTPVRFSKDGGKTVGQTTIGIHVDHHALWWDPENPDHYIVGNDGGIGITWDKGGNYDFPNALALGQFYAVSYNMDFPYRVCGGLQDNGTWCGPSRRRQGDIDNHMWATVSGGDGFYAPQDPEDHDLMYAESQGGRMSRINTATGARRSLERPSWSEEVKPLRDELVLLEDEAGDSPSPEQQARMDELEARITADSAAYSLRYNWSTPMVLSPHDRNVLYVGASRVLKSTDRGDGLAPISPDLTYADAEKISVSTETTGGITRDATGAETHATITTLAESYIHAGWLYVGTDDGRVWMTRDDGASWTELTGRFDGVPDGTWVSRVEPSHHDANTFYVSFDGHRADDFDPHLYVTTDGGDTFRSISTGLPTGAPDYIHVVREDPYNPDLLFVGSDVGVYMSMDRGVSWQRFMNGLPTVPVHDLKIHPRERELIAGTHGRSVWIVDIAPLEQVAGSDLGEDLVLFEPKPALQYGDAPIGGESTGHRTFEGQSVRYGAEIAYWIPSEVSTALMREAREAQQATGDTERPRGGGAGGDGPGRPGIPQAQFAILDSGGDTVQVLTGAMASGLRKVYWDFRPRVEPEPKSPSELRDSVDNARLRREVADSLIADGEDEALVNRAVEEMSSGGGFRGRFGGGGETPRRGFRERPGETYPRPRAEAREAEDRQAPAAAAAPGGPARAGGPAQSEVRAMQRTIRGAMRDRGAGFGGFGGFGGGDQELAEPGEYTVVMTIGEHTRTVPLEVIRAPGYSPDP